MLLGENVCMMYVCVCVRVEMCKYVCSMYAQI